MLIFKKVVQTAKTPRAPSNTKAFSAFYAHPLGAAHIVAKTLAPSWRSWRLGGSSSVSGLMRSLLIACFALMVASPLHAAAKKDPAKEAQRRMQMQMKQVQDEKAAVEQEKAELSQELEAMKKKAGEIESSVARANRSKAAAEKEAEALKQVKAEQSEKIVALEKQFSESQQSLRDTRQSLQQETSQKQRLEQNLGARDKELNVCETKNKKLYQYQVELINRAQNRGSLDVLLEVEPLTQMKRVEIENLLEEYRDKIDNEQIVKRGR